MYVPSVYQTKDPSWLGRIIRSYPLALLVANGPQYPYATHVPVIFATGASQPDHLVGAEMLGHMNRANPHWGSLRSGGKARLIFTGPHGYVSPAVYENDPAAPTWDFVSVHIEGTLQLIEDLEETLLAIRLTVDVLEGTFGEGWNPEPSIQYFRQVGGDVGAFRFQAERAHGMFKLSQEREPQVQDRLITRFGASQSGIGRELAVLMREFGVGTRRD